MNILYITYDGINERLVNSQVMPYLKGLAEEKAHNISVVSFIKEPLNKAIIDENLRGNHLDGLYLLKYHKRFKLLSSLFDIIASAIKGIRIINKKNIEIVHARSYVACASAMLIKIFTGTPYLFDIRGFLGEERLDSGDWTKRSLSYKAIKFTEKRLYKKADFVVTLSEKAKDIVADDFKVKKEDIKVIPTCADIGRFSAYPVNHEKIYDFVYSGSIGTWYMLGEMLDFFKKYLKHDEKAKFLFLTDEKNRKKIFNEAVKRGIKKDLIFVKHAAYDDMPLELSKCRAAIYFIKQCFSKKASCPTKLGESLAAGLPIVTNTGIGDIEEIINSKGVGVLIETFSDEAFELASVEIKDIINNVDVRERARKIANDHFSLKKAVSIYDRIYRDIIEHE